MTDTSTDPFAQPPAPPTHEVPRPKAPTPKAPRDGVLSLHKQMLIGGLALATGLPNLFISSLIDEREQRQSGVQQEVRGNWGREENVYSPILVVPYQSMPARPRQYLKIAT